MGNDNFDGLEDLDFSITTPEKEVAGDEERTEDSNLNLDLEGLEEAKANEEVEVNSETEAEEDDNTKPEISEKTPSWVKALRKETRTLRQENKRLQKRLAKDVKEEELGKEPTLEDFDHDEMKYAAALKNWMTESARIEERKAAKEKKKQEQEKIWNAKLAAYHTKRKELGAKDFEEQAEMVESTLSVVQQGIIVDAGENPAKLVYVLGKNPELLSKLSEIDNPVTFAYTLAKIENKMQNKSSKKVAPERKVIGNSPTIGGVDKTLERLRADAEKTGDYTKVIAYRKRKNV